ncbi:MAG: response regulator transcription factor [Desulfobacterales bacterium]|nr:response regulator transcription factor [Desulfobacterales bacterium]
MKKIKVIIADDHTIVRKGLCSLLDGENDIDVIGEAENGREAIKQVEKLMPDVVLLDISMPGLNGLEATRQLKKKFPKLRILILTMHDNDEYIFETLRAGASGYLVKRSAPNELISAIKAVCRGESFLSPSISKRVIETYVRGASREDGDEAYGKLTDREREVLQLIAEGKLNREIAELLHISVKTVESHRAHIVEKLNIRNTAELTQYAIRKGIIRIET